MTGGADSTTLPQELLARAYAHAARGENAAACEAFSVALERAPDADGWNAFGHALAALGELDRAERAFVEALRMNPHLTAARFAQGLNLLRLGDPSAAEASFRSILAARAYVEGAYYGMAQALAQQRRFDDAVAASEEWLRMATPDMAQQAAQRAAVERGVPALLFIAMHKSASEYIRSVLLAATGAPLFYPDLGTYPRNFLIPSAARRVALGGCVTRIHLDASEHNLTVLEGAGLATLAVHLRDPRAATLSFAHHLARVDEDEFHRFRLYHDAALPLAYRSWDPEKQRAWCVEHYFPQALSTANGWHELACSRRTSMRIHLTTYENFVLDPAAFFRELFAFFAWAPANLEQVLAEHRPELDRNFRSGRPDEWRTVFTPEQQTWMGEQLARTRLHQLGWKD